MARACAKNAIFEKVKDMNMNGSDGSLMSVSGFLKAIIKGYKEKFHWPKQREVYHTEVSYVHIGFLVALILMVGFLMWLNFEVSPSILTKSKRFYAPNKSTP
jgi:hypothetical protein